MTPAAGSEPGGDRAMPVYPMASCLNGTHPPFNIETHPTGCPHPHHATPPSSVAERAALYDHGRGPLIAGTDVASVAQFDEHAHERPLSVAGLREVVARERGRLAGLPVPGSWHNRWGWEAAIREALRSLDAIDAATSVAATPDDDDLRDEPGDLRRVMEAERAARRASEGGE